MKFVAGVKAFSDAMGAVARVVERRNTYPILANVHLTAKDDDLVLRATDLDIEITTSIKVKVAKPGVTTLPAAMLSDVLKKMPKDIEVTFELVDGDAAAKVAAGRSRFNIATISPDSYPDMKPVQSQTTVFEMEAVVLRKALEKVAFAISTEETRYYLNGVYMHGVSDRERGTGLRFVATDGHRMARCFRAVEAAAKMPGIIVPRKTVAEIERLCELAGDQNLTITVTDTRIIVQSATTKLLSKLIEGTFPDYERVTPKGNNLAAHVDVKKLLAAVDRVSILQSDRGGKAVKMSFTTANLSLDVNNPDHGSANEELEVEFDAEGKSHEIGFNSQYLKDIMGAIGSGKATMAMQDAGSPALITHQDDPTVAFVLMPMRV